MTKLIGPLVGVGVVIYNAQDEILLMKRKGSHGAGEWSLPGGHLEAGESFEECCIREVKEETNLDIDEVRQLGFSNDIFKDVNKHYVTLFFRGYVTPVSGELQLMEPDKCFELGWFKRNKFPEPMFLPLGHLVIRDLF